MIIIQLYRFITLFIIGIYVSIGASILGYYGFKNAKTKMQRLFFVNAARLWRLDIRVEGELAQPPLLIVANHCSYIDVVVVGSLSHIRFTPKSEVKKWPFLGTMAKAFDVIFVSRDRKDSKITQQALFEALNKHEYVCVFPEGTTNNGRTLKPFKASLFALAEQWPYAPSLIIQPVAVCYETVDGIPMNESNWDIIAWYGDDTLIRHLWRLSRVKKIKVTLKCLTPVKLREGENRKTLCNDAYTAIDLTLHTFREKIS